MVIFKALESCENVCVEAIRVLHCRDIAIQRAIERHEAQDTTVMPLSGGGPQFVAPDRASQQGLEP